MPEPTKKPEDAKQLSDAVREANRRSTGGQGRR